MIGKRFVLAHDRRGLSPIFATILLATIIIVVGSIAFLFANNLTTNAKNNYVETMVNSEQSISEGVSFENIAYSSSTATLTAWIHNFGAANNLKVDLVFIYNASDVNHALLGAYSGNSISALSTLDSPTHLISGNCLNNGQEGSFTVAFGQSLTLQTGVMYSIRLVTNSGSSFICEFTP
jgi:hypothetical protein